jgi:hypothetical protein
MLEALVDDRILSLLREWKIIRQPQDLDLLSSVYTPYSEAVRQVKERWADPELEKKIRTHASLPDLVQGFTTPHAILCRSLIVPNREVSYFLDMVEEPKLPHLFLEYEDKFVGRNKDKHALGKVICEKGHDHRGRCFYKKTTIINFNTEEGKLLGQVTTRWGESLIAFKRRLLEFVHPGQEKHIADLTTWFNSRRYATKYYYLDFLSIFLRHGILFENFLLGDPDEREFFYKKMLPSFKKLEELYGIKPLIVPLLPLEFEKNEGWLAYPEHLEAEIQKHVNLIPKE